jgi:hypothetical protein
VLRVGVPWDKGALRHEVVKSRIVARANDFMMKVVIKRTGRRMNLKD